MKEREREREERERKKRKKDRCDVIWNREERALYAMTKYRNGVAESIVRTVHV